MAHRRRLAAGHPRAEVWLGRRLRTMPTTAYPDVRFDDYVRPTARTVVRPLVARRLGEPAVAVTTAAQRSRGHQDSPPSRRFAYSVHRR
jgi:hypothetical protein